MKKTIVGYADIVEERGSMYRYSLKRTWGSNKTVLFVMLNPSTANANSDDPTIRRCVGFAQKWGYSTIEVVNLYALITPDPMILKSHEYPVGDRNDFEIERAGLCADKIVVAWGSFKQINADRARAVINTLYLHKQKLWCLGITKNGSPKHPLYIKADTELTEFAHLI